MEQFEIKEAPEYAKQAESRAKIVAKAIATTAETVLISLLNDAKLSPGPLSLHERTLRDFV